MRVQERMQGDTVGREDRARGQGDMATAEETGERGAAEKAAEGTFNKLSICGTKVTIRSVVLTLFIVTVYQSFIKRWGKSQGKNHQGGAGPSTMDPMLPAGTLPPQEVALQHLLSVSGSFTFLLF